MIITRLLTQKQNFQEKMKTNLLILTQTFRLMNKLKKENQEKPVLENMCLL